MRVKSSIFSLLRKTGVTGSDGVGMSCAGKARSPMVAREVRVSWLSDDADERWRTGTGRAKSAIVDVTVLRSEKRCCSAVMAPLGLQGRNRFTAEEATNRNRSQLK